MMSTIDEDMIQDIAEVTGVLSLYFNPLSTKRADDKVCVCKIQINFQLKLCYVKNSKTRRQTLDPDETAHSELLLNKSLVMLTYFLNNFLFGKCSVLNSAIKEVFV